MCKKNVCRKVKLLIKCVQYKKLKYAFVICIDDIVLCIGIAIKYIIIFSFFNGYPGKKKTNNGKKKFLIKC